MVEFDCTTKVLRELSAEEQAVVQAQVDADAAADFAANASAYIDAERDRRIAKGFLFNGVLYQSRDGDLANISGAAVLALGAIIGGTQPGNLRWHGGATDFEWIADDNTRHPMDAQTVMAFGAVAANWKSAHIFAANDLKANPPTDYASDQYWPA